MKTATLLLVCGVMLCLTTVSCRKDKPPKITICILDGHGGGDCVDQADQNVYMPPSEMLNMWCTTQQDMAAFSSWCYQTSKGAAQAGMSAIKSDIEGAK